MKKNDIYEYDRSIAYEHFDSIGVLLLLFGLKRLFFIGLKLVPNGTKKIKWSKYLAIVERNLQHLLKCIENLISILMANLWEDDPVQFYDPDYRGGANHISLRKAQQNFIEYGACDEESVKFVKKPTEKDLKGSKMETTESERLK